MNRDKAFRRVLFSSLVVCTTVVLTACAPAAAPTPVPTQPAKPAAQPTPAAPAVKPTAVAPAAQPTAVPPTKAPAKASVALRAGCSYAKGDIYCDGMDKFAELVGARSKGEVQVTVFYQSLGVEQQLTESVMAGSVDIGIISNGNAGRFTDAYFIYDLPFVFRDNMAMLKVKRGPVGRKLDEKFEKDLNLKALFMTSQGSGRDVQTRSKPMRTPADLKGVKIRAVSTPIDLATWRAWGANPTPIDAAQALTALQQGVVEGLGGTPVFLLTSKWYEPLKHGIHVEYQQLFQQVYMNAKIFSSLSPDHQKVLVEASQEAETWQNEYALGKARTARQELTKLGLVYYEPTPEEYTQWASVREKVWQEAEEQLKGKIDLGVAKQLYEAQ